MVNQPFGQRKIFRCKPNGFFFFRPCRHQTPYFRYRRLFRRHFGQRRRRRFFKQRLGFTPAAYRKAARDATTQSAVLPTTTYADWP